MLTLSKEKRIKRRTGLYVYNPLRQKNLKLFERGK
jgi:hypothetical protein